MADLTGLIKDYAKPLGEFLKKQFLIWLAVVSNPHEFVASVDIRSNESVLPAVYFSLFVYVASLLIAAAGLTVYGKVDVLNTVFLISDLVLTFICFSLIGLTLFAIGKALGGSGGFMESMVAGFYLTAFWPLIQFADYFLSPSLSFLDEEQTAVFRFAILLIITAGFAWFLTVRFYPVVAHVHKFGRARAIVVAVIQIVVVPTLILMFLAEPFAQLFASR